MRITQWGEYGLLCSMYLAHQHTIGQSTVGAADIAKAHGIDVQYAQQILQRLRKGDIISSVRGPHGGYRLTRAASNISLGDILRAAEGATFEIICDTKPLSPERCEQDANCALRGVWGELAQHIDSFLEERSLADLAHEHFRHEQPIKLGASEQVAAVHEPKHLDS